MYTLTQIFKAYKEAREPKSSTSAHTGQHSQLVRAQVHQSQGLNNPDSTPRMDKATMADFMATADVGETETTTFCLLTLNAYILERTLQLSPKLTSQSNLQLHSSQLKLPSRLYDGRMILLLPRSSILKEACAPVSNKFCWDDHTDKCCAYRDYVDTDSGFGYPRL